MSQSEFTKIFAALSTDLARGPNDEYFLDGRGGFVATLAWAESAIRTIDSTGNHELAFQYVKKCRTILDSVGTHGWTVAAKRVAMEHTAVMRNQQWE
jgi:hypothetical protein